jgi:hypothetical protein
MTFFNDELAEVNPASSYNSGELRSRGIGAPSLGRTQAAKKQVFQQPASPRFSNISTLLAAGWGRTELTI